MKPFWIFTLLTLASLLACTNTSESSNGSGETLVGKTKEKDGIKNKERINKNPSVETVNSGASSSSKKLSFSQRIIGKTSALSVLSRKGSQQSAASAVVISEMNENLKLEMKQLKALIASSNKVLKFNSPNYDFIGLQTYRDFDLKQNLKKGLTLDSIIAILHYLAIGKIEIRKKECHFHADVTDVVDKMITAINKREEIYKEYAKKKSFSNQAIDEALQKDTELNAEFVSAVSTVIWDDEREKFLVVCVRSNSKVCNHDSWYGTYTITESFQAKCSNILELKKNDISALSAEDKMKHKFSLKRMLMLYAYRQNLFKQNNKQNNQLAEQFTKCADPYKRHLDTCCKKYNNPAVVDVYKNVVMTPLNSILDGQTLIPNSSYKHSIWNVDMWAAESVIKTTLNGLAKLELSKESEADEREMIRKILAAVILAQSEVSQPHCQLAFPWNNQENVKEFAQLTSKIYNNHDRVDKLITNFKASRQILLDNTGTLNVNANYLNYIVQWNMLNHLKDYPELIPENKMGAILQKHANKIGDQLRSILSELTNIIESEVSNTTDKLIQIRMEPSSALKTHKLTHWTNHLIYLTNFLSHYKADDVKYWTDFVKLQPDYKKTLYDPFEKPPNHVGKLFTTVKRFRHDNDVTELWAVNAKVILNCVADLGSKSTLDENAIKTLQEDTTKTQHEETLTSLFKLLVKFTVVLDSSSNSEFNTQIKENYKNLDDDLKGAVSKVLQGSIGDKIIDNLNNDKQPEELTKEEARELRAKCKLLLNSNKYSDDCDDLKKG